MADEPEDDDELLLDEPIEAEEPPKPDAEPPEEAEEPDELVVTFGEEEGEPEDLLGHLRKEIRERDKTIATLRRQVPVETTPELGEKPTLESCGWDEGKYESDLLAYNQHKSAIEQKKSAAAKQREAADAAFKAKLEDFGRKKEALKAPDFDDAESLVVGATTPMQQAIIVRAAKNSANVIYALGKYPARLAEIAAIQDPIDLALAVAAMEGTIKVTSKRRAIEPEGTVRGSGRLSSGPDKILERLENEAEKTGDRTKVYAYKKSLKEKAASRG